MNMFAFYAVRGWKLSDLAALSKIEKMFLYRAQENHYLEEAQRYNAMFGGKG